MASYFTSAFVLFFLPAAVLLYGIIPKRFRWVVLLVFSYIFAFAISKALIAFMAVSTISIYVAGLAMKSRIERRDLELADAKSGKKEIRKRCKRYTKSVLIVGIVVNFGILIVLKYLGFFESSAASLLSLFGMDVTFVSPKIGIPIGISFYTLMAASYLIDVYRESIQADRNLGRVALFLCFFPQIMEGPICRYGQTAFALTAGSPLTKDSVCHGTLRILVGVAKKVIIADRLELFVKPVFDNYASYDGGIIALVAILYTIQLYCDFSGCMDVALGIGQIFNVKLPENFRQPFFSRTASEFWQRWHITLGTWFKDYIYYPISLSKPVKSLTSKARKRFGNRYGPLLTSTIALFCVWIGNGLWHGAGSQYIFFGMYYFVLIVCGGFIEPLAQKSSARLGINRSSAGYRTFQIIRTLIIIFIGEMFFRANGLEAGLNMFGQIFTTFSFDSLANGTLVSLGLSGADYLIAGIFVVLVLVMDIANERGHNLIDAMRGHSMALRLVVCVALFFVILIFGAYGHGYAFVPPMYAQF